MSSPVSMVFSFRLWIAESSCWAFQMSESVTWRFLEVSPLEHRTATQGEGRKVGIALSFTAFHHKRELLEGECPPNKPYAMLLGFEIPDEIWVICQHCNGSSFKMISPFLQVPDDSETFLLSCWLSPLCLPRRLLDKRKSKLIWLLSVSEHWVVQSAERIRAQCNGTTQPSHETFGVPCCFGGQESPAQLWYSQCHLPLQQRKQQQGLLHVYGMVGLP